MLRFVLIIFLFLTAMGCNSRSSYRTNAWLIGSSTTEIPLFRKGNCMVFKEDSVLFTIDAERVSHPAIISSHRLLLNDGMTKWLFRVETSPNRIILTELYQKNPIIITLTNL